jgi:cation/acetate symporter
LFVTYLAAKRTKTAADFYAAGGGVSGLQNGWAIAGDYLSAASFLGIAGLISLYGYDGFMYSVGWLVAYITVLLVIAEPCRNIGKYTMGDILAFRNNPKTVKTFMAISTITVSTFYLTAQMVGGGVLVKTLIGIDYEISVAVVGVLMLGMCCSAGWSRPPGCRSSRRSCWWSSLVMVISCGPVWLQRPLPRGGRRLGIRRGGAAARRRRAT